MGSLRAGTVCLLTGLYLGLPPVGECFGWGSVCLLRGRVPVFGGGLCLGLLPVAALAASQRVLAAKLVIALGGVANAWLAWLGGGVVSAP